MSLTPQKPEEPVIAGPLPVTGAGPPVSADRVATASRWVP